MLCGDISLGSCDDTVRCNVQSFKSKVHERFHCGAPSPQKQGGSDRCPPLSSVGVPLALHQRQNLDQATSLVVFPRSVPSSCLAH